MTPKFELNMTDFTHMKDRVTSPKNQKNCQHRNTVAGANDGIQRVVCNDCGRMSLIEFRQAVTNRRPNPKGSALHI